MSEKRILVPLEASEKSLKSIHYALALAERLKAHVYILQHHIGTTRPMSHASWMDAALSDLIDSARRAGLNISHHVGTGEWKEDIVGLVAAEGIDLVVFGGEDDGWEGLLVQLKPLIPPHIIHVKPKHHNSYRAEEDDFR
ncbi:MAG: universal stress protein [Pseudomonadota bacterium]